MSSRKQKQGTDEVSAISLDHLVGGSGGVGSEHTIQDTGIVTNFDLSKQRMLEHNFTSASLSFGNTRPLSPP